MLSSGAGIWEGSDSCRAIIGTKNKGGGYWRGRRYGRYYTRKGCGCGSAVLLLAFPFCVLIFVLSWHLVRSIG